MTLERLPGISHSVLAQQLRDILGRWAGFVAVSLDQGPRVEGQEENTMDWQSRYLDKLDKEVAEIKHEFHLAEQRIGARIDQMLGEIRHLDNEVKQEIRDIRADMREVRRWTTGLVLEAGVLVLTAFAAVVYVVLSK